MGRRNQLGDQGWLGVLWKVKNFRTNYMCILSHKFSKKKQHKSKLCWHHRGVSGRWKVGGQLHVSCKFASTVFLKKVYHSLFIHKCVGNKQTGHNINEWQGGWFLRWPIKKNYTGNQPTYEDFTHLAFSVVIMMMTVSTWVQCPKDKVHLTLGGGEICHRKLLKIFWEWWPYKWWKVLFSLFEVW